MRRKRVSYGAAVLAGIAVYAGAASGSTLSGSRGRGHELTGTGRHTTVTSSLRSWNTTYRITRGPDGNPWTTSGVYYAPPRSKRVTKLDPTTVVCHGGIATSDWQVGDLEPALPKAALHLSLFFDGRPVASLLRGGMVGNLEDAPAEIGTVLRCSKGEHRLWAQVTSIAGAWGIPYADSTDHVQRGFVATEIR